MFMKSASGGHGFPEIDESLVRDLDDRVARGLLWRQQRAEATEGETEKSESDLVKTGSWRR